MMENRPEPLLQTFTTSFELDSDLRLHYQILRREFDVVKNAGRKWNVSRFVAVATNMAAFGAADPAGSLDRSGENCTELS
jgi:hypothetical protein